MSKNKSKMILGLFSVLIMLHHLALRTSASSVPAIYRRPGLSAFVPIGYLFVAFFFFCSGYGLIKSLRTKEGYMDGFLIRRLNRILLIFVLSELVFLIVRFAYGAMGLPLNPYSWFVYTIIILYFGFFLIYRKSRKHQRLLMALWILAYGMICHFLVKGNWWINSAPVFLLGLWVAEKEETVLSGFSKHKAVYYGISGLTLISGFLISENADAIGHSLHIPYYGIINFFLLLFQIMAGAAFSFLLYLLTGFFKEENGSRVSAMLRKILLFYGNMSLEFYLIHGLFVQLFSYRFIFDTVLPLYYIRNVFLYTVVVLICSTTAALLLKKTGDLITDFYSHADFFQKICRDAKKAALVLLILFILFTVIYSVYRHNLSAKAGEKLDQYREENIVFADAGGKEVAAYVTGNGPYTLVFLGAHFDSCPTLSLRVLTDRLQDRYRCVIIDYPGKGFSPDTPDDRTADFFADVIFQTLNSLNENRNTVLVAHETSAIYAYRYMEKYPDEVRGFVGLSALMPQLAMRFLEGTYHSADEYQWFLSRYVTLEGVKQKFMVLTGFVGFQEPEYDWLFYGSGLKEYYPVMQEMFVRNYMQSAQVSEEKNISKNCIEESDFQFPKDLPAVFLLDDYARKNKPCGVDWEKEYEKLISNGTIQTIKTFSGDPYAVYYGADTIAKMIDESIKEERR